MSYRFMRMLVFFDLPTETDADRREFDRDKLFVIQGIRSFFSDDKAEAFLKTVLSQGYQVLLVDCVARKKLPSEKRLTIDNDLCEF